MSLAEAGWTASPLAFRNKSAVWAKGTVQNFNSEACIVIGSHDTELQLGGMYRDQCR